MGAEGVCARKAHTKMEMNERMSKRFWLLGLGILVLIGLVACGSLYDRSYDGLLLVGSQGSSIIETFSFSLDKGTVATVDNSPYETGNLVCMLNGIPSSIVIDPAGVYAYAIINANTLCDTATNKTKTGIAAFHLSSVGNISQVGTFIPDPNPTALAMDPAGKFLFVAEGLSTTSIANAGKYKTPCVQNQQLPTINQVGVCVYAIGSGGSLTVVQPNYTLPQSILPPNISAVAASYTFFPNIGVNGIQNAVCSTPGNNAPQSEFLYAVDTANFVVWELGVNTTTGALENPSGATAVPFFTTDANPTGVAVDPCDRFVYVSDALYAKVSGYAICDGLPTSPQYPCQSQPQGGLVPTPNSPYALLGNVQQPGPIVVDPFGNNVYVAGVFSNTVSPLKISPSDGSLTALTPNTVATGLRPTSIAIRGDGNWMFVTNFNSASVSQYSVSPGAGTLTAEPAIQTDNYPWGVAVK